MQIESLVVSIEDSDLQGVLQKYSATRSPMQVVSANFTNQGLVVHGKVAKLGVSKSFEATVQLHTIGTIVNAEVSDIHPMLLEVSLVKVLLMEWLINQVSDKVPGIFRHDDYVQLDVSQLLEHKNIPMQIEAMRIRCSKGMLTLEISGLLDFNANLT